MKSTIDRYFLGLRAPFKGWSFLKENPKIRKLATIPFIITFFVSVLGFALGFNYIPSLLESFLPKSEGILSTFLHWSGFFVGIIAAFFILLLVIVLIANLIGVPFYAVLSEKALLQYEGKPLGSESTAEKLKRSLKLFWISILKTVILLVLAVVLFAASFVPVIQVFAAYIGLLIASLDCMDYAMEFKGMGLRHRFLYLKLNLPELSGFATTLGVSFLIPGLNFLFLPVAITGATLLVSDLERS